jgi:SOS-response transcriptional repressor LexA
MKYSKLFDTLQNLINIKPQTTQIADIIGVPVRTLYTRGQRDSAFTYEELRKIETAYGIIGGLTGSMIATDNNCVEIDYFADVWASCGTGATVFEETSEKISIPTSLIQNYSKSNRYSMINSRGDSMYPFCLDRDKLVIEHWQGGQIIDNAIYVFRYANELFVKRLIKNVTQIIIKSDNPNYKPIEISGKDPEFEIIGRIVGLMREMV